MLFSEIETRAMLTNNAVEYILSNFASFSPMLASKICVRIKVKLLAHIMSKTACNFIYNKCYMTTKRRNVFRRFLEIDCSRVTALFVDTAVYAPNELRAYNEPRVLCAGL